MTATRAAAVLLVLRAGLATATDLTVAALNLGCRWDPEVLKMCDNCEVRFEQIANAISGTGAENFEGIPDFDNIDVLLVQELSAPDGDAYENINEALSSRGFIYSSVQNNGGLPSPTAGSPRCAEPPYPDGLYDVLDWFGQATELAPNNGGLITWSKYPIADQFDGRWCSHAFPAPAGYLVTLINFGASPVVVINTHLYPETAIPGFDVTPSDIRTMQFTELAGLTKTLDEQLSGQYSIIVGGDFNEDMYGLPDSSPGSGNNQVEPDCTKITDHATTKFAQLGLNLRSACEGTGDFGKATWDVTNNDLAENRAPGKHEVLDYLIQTHSSTGVTGVGEQTVVGVLKKTAADPWEGTLCSGPSGTPPTYDSPPLYALSDHNWISATFDAPEGHTGQALVAFRSAKGTWQSGAATCGQEDTYCIERSDCCQGASESWNGAALSCMNDYSCQTCKSTSVQCDWQWFDSECCAGMTCLPSGCQTCKTSGQSCNINWESIASECCGASLGICTPWPRCSSTWSYRRRRRWWASRLYLPSTTCTVANECS